MSYVIKDKETYLKFDRFVRDMDIVTTAEPVVHYSSATTFSSDAAAKLAIKELDKVGYDTQEYKVLDVEKIVNDERKRIKKRSKKYLKDTWDNTSTERKREMLGEILAKKGAKAVMKWLKEVKDTSGITPETFEERLQKRIKEVEESLGIKLTDEQIEALKAKGE